MTWIVLALVASAVCGWTVAAGLYLQLKDALRLAESWRTIAVEAFGDLTRERHLSRFAVRVIQLPGGKQETLEEFWRDVEARRVVDDA